MKFDKKTVAILSGATAAVVAAGAAGVAVVRNRKRAEKLAKSIAARKAAPNRRWKSR